MGDTRSQIDNSKDRIRWYMVHHPNTPPSVLAEIASADAPRAVLERIAEHPRVGQEVLMKLACHQDSEVRAAVSENINVPDEVILLLAKDECPDVRYRVAENPMIALDVLASLAEDENPYVAHRARTTVQRLQAAVFEGEFRHTPPAHRRIV